MVFGREPEDDEAYRAHSGLSTIDELRRTLIQSPEGRARLRSDLRADATTYEFDYFRSLLAFVHMEKTGGTSLYDVLASHYGASRSSPPHLAFLPELPLGELNQYDFVSGHFSYQEAMALPRSSKRCITVFREPFARLVSFYRFQRAHPVDANGDPITVLAQSLEPVPFFRHPAVRRSHRTDNLYLRTFGPPRKRAMRRLPRRLYAAIGPEHPRAALHLAAKRIESLDALGITEDMGNSMRLIGSSLGLPIPSDAPRLQVTDRFHADTHGFRAVEPVPLSPELRDAMLPLVRHDLKLYDHARTLFRQRLAALDRDKPAGTAPLRARRGFWPMR